MMKFVRNKNMENYILHTKWEDFPEAIQKRAVVCGIDLMLALLLGSKGRQFQTGVKLAKMVYREGDIPVVGLQETFSLMGAATAMGHASNSFDIDDGHNMIKGHPGTSIVSGVLAAALLKDVSYKEFLTTLVLSYEIAIRSGLAMQDYYNYLHSTGSYGAVGTSAGVSRLMELNEDQLNNALSIADFHAPMTPVMRAVEYPSMNKDGVPFGTMIGVAAVLETIAGTTGKTNLLELDKYDYLGDDLGSNYEIMNLYFKPYTCCRWAHPPIDAALSLIKKHRINSNLISEINVFTFLAATRLSKIYPESTDEAQYNISFPIAAAIVDGDLGFTQVIDENLNRKEVIEIMDKINYFVDEEIESKFPQERLCKVEIKTKNGESFMSDIFGPRGEAKDNVDLSWIVKKFKRRTTFFLNDEQQDEIIAMLTNLEHLSMRKVIETINSISRV